MKKSQIIVMFLTLLSVSAFAETHLTLIGGGKRPTEALRAFLSNVDPLKSIWVLPWGTAFPNESFEAISIELKALGAADVKCACEYPISSETKNEIQRAGAFYFPGGNQNLIMERLTQSNLLDLVREKFTAGTPIAGTSAGTAIATDPMLTGEGAALGEGLGLLSGFLVDQHFWVRNREQRLLSALEALRVERSQLKMGLGIDEGMAVQITEKTHFQVFGPTRVSLYRWNSDSSKFEKKDLFNQDEIDVSQSF